MRWLALVLPPPANLLAQVPVQADVPTSVSAALIFLGTIMFSACVAVIRTLYKDGKAKDAAIQALQTSSSAMQQEQLKQSLTVTLDAANRIRESDAVQERVLTMIHQISARSPSSEQLVEVTFWLKQLRDMKGGA